MSERKEWDAIVIGTGIGGGTIGRALAEKGMSVLFLEKGPAGYRLEANGMDNSAMSDPVARAMRGSWPEPVEARIDGISRTFFAPLGSGVGGSSVFYAAAMERPEPHDLDDMPEHPHPTGGWPVSYCEMRPYFDAAEAMYHVCGTEDPLSNVLFPALVAPPPISPGDAAIIDRLQNSGLHPYRLHSAIRNLEGCRHCIGVKCPISCKMDGRSAGVEPALATGCAELLDRWEVSRILIDGNRAVGVRSIRDGNTFDIKAKRIILSAGALSSPRLLMASGYACRSGLLGRNLMFHLNEIFALWPGRIATFPGASKSIAFRDLYHADGYRLGMVQAMGLTARYGEIVHYLRQLVEQTPLVNFRLIRELMRIPAFMAERILGEAKIFVGLLEDYPVLSNRVYFDSLRPAQIKFDYCVTPELVNRRAFFRRKIRHAFRGQLTLFLNNQPEPNFGHPCGTLKFGREAATSVLDKDCRPHGIDCLYVVDASFMPTSMGVNPSLTIAANALRVADRIEQSL